MKNYKREGEQFCYLDAVPFDGIKVVVHVFDSGLHKDYIGVLTPIDDVLTKIDEDELLNECILSVKEY